MTDHLATALLDEQRRHRYVAEGVPQIECLCGWTSSRVEHPWLQADPLEEFAVHVAERLADVSRSVLTAEEQHTPVTRT
jgi:hypothetical protein